MGYEVILSILLTIIGIISMYLDPTDNTIILMIVSALIGLLTGKFHERNKRK